MFIHFIPSTQRQMALLASQDDQAPVLIVGSNGAGRGAIAHWIHSQGPRSGLLFHTAHRKSSLAQQILDAQGGTLLVPEIGEWPLSEQRILGQFLERKTIPHPRFLTGNPIPLLLNVRIMATTSQNLEKRAEGGLFSPELLKKINVFRIEMPELIDRKSDFREITLGLLNEITREIHKEHIQNLAPITWERFESYDWPGNLRELRNVLRIAVVACDTDQIELAHLPEFGRNRTDFHATRKDFEKVYLTELLKSHQWQLDRTCQAGKMDRNTLQRKIIEYSLQAPDPQI